MDKWLCGAVVVARNEERNIQPCLESLKRQTVNLFLVVVNDGSLDNTGKVASKLADVVVNLPRHEKNWTGRPELAKITNAGFEVLQKKDVSYVLTSGADAVYPSNYVEEITKRMEDEKIIIASGVAENDVSRSLTPRGCGRIIERQWFENVRFRYPENYNFEGYLVYKALSQGGKVKVFHDLRFKLSRKTVLSKRKLYLWGKGMRALNYWWPYAIGRIILIGIKQPRNGYEMLRGYLSETPRYKDLESFVPNYQMRTFLSRFKETIRRF